VKVESSDSERLQFRVTANSLPLVAPDETRAHSWPVLRVAGLEPGSYTLLIDGQRSVTATARVWADGVSLHKGPDVDQAERLRLAIVAKNQLYFHRWRPQNETYLFGFRKHEQGQNAREIPEFDPLIAAAEKEIFKLALPKPHTYELKRDGSK
jgi:hypothetical protein